MECSLLHSKNDEQKRRYRWTKKFHRQWTANSEWILWISRKYWIKSTCSTNLQSNGLASYRNLFRCNRRKTMKSNIQAKKRWHYSCLLSTQWIMLPKMRRSTRWLWEYQANWSDRESRASWSEVGQKLWFQHHSLKIDYDHPDTFFHRFSSQLWIHSVDGTRTLTIENQVIICLSHYLGRENFVNIVWIQIHAENLGMKKRLKWHLIKKDNCIFQSNSLCWRIGGKFKMIAYCAMVAKVTKYWKSGQRRCFDPRRVPNITQSQMTYKIDIMSFRKLITIVNTTSVTSMPNL